MKQRIPSRGRGLLPMIAAGTAWQTGSGGKVVGTLLGEESRQERIRAQIIRILEKRRGLGKFQLANELSCDIARLEFEASLSELVREGRVSIRAKWVDPE